MLISTELDASFEFDALIEAELDRLGVGTEADACSGLIVEADKDSEAVVRVFDDHNDGRYYADQLLAILLGLNPEDVSLESESPDNIWGLIARVEVA